MLTSVQRKNKKVMNHAVYSKLIKDFSTGEQIALTTLFSDSLSLTNITTVLSRILKAVMQKSLLL